MAPTSPLPGSDGEHAMQLQHGTTERAQAFYANQMLGTLNDRMLAFIAQRDMMFVSTADARGHCDCSIRCGEVGFVIALNAKTLIYPEYRGNGVMASLGNIIENPHVGLLMVDFERDCIGLHINGKAEIVDTESLLHTAALPASAVAACQQRGGRRPERWVRVSVEEAYIHCAKHIPMLAKVPKKIAWGTDEPALKGGDYFGVAGRDKCEE